MRQLPESVESDALMRIPSSPQQPQRRLRNRESTIRAVLESAQRLFTTKGFDNTSLVDIAAETGLSPRGVILHFSSKADIAAALMFRDMQARAHSYRDHPADSPITRIHAFFSWLAEGDQRMFINFPALWAFAARWSETLEHTAEMITAELLAPVREALKAGVASGELRDVDANVACEMLWNTYLSGLRRAAIHGGKPADALTHVERAMSLLRAP
ncbi:MAG TPA: TetR/AcrR family transcriptional regulator [Casimicrobiaceae bacterium]|nr:TetR/AcrR family transcriptional regulator [Casimicrobiaceae bacterium]